MKRVIATRAVCVSLAFGIISGATAGCSMVVDGVESSTKGAGSNSEVQGSLASNGEGHTYGPATQFPLDEYRPTAEQRRQLFNAQNLLIRDCASARGVSIVVAPAKLPQSDFFALYEAPVRPLDVGYANANGYHMPPTSSPGRSLVEGLSASAAQVVGGWVDDGLTARPTDPFLLSGGCLGESRRKLSGSDDQFGVDGLAYTVTGFISQAAQQVLSDPALLSVESSWSQCMRDSGYSAISSPADAIRTGMSTGAVTADERKQARADAQCKQVTGFAATWARLTISYQESVINSHADQLISIRNQIAQSIARAADIVSKG